MSTSVNYPCGLGTFCQLSVHPRDLQSPFCASAGSSINFQCSLGTFRQHIFATVGLSVKLSQLSMPPWGLRSTFRAAAGLSVNIPCGERTIRQLFLRPRDSVNFCELSVHPLDFTLIFHASLGTVRKLPSTFRASRDLL